MTPTFRSPTKVLAILSAALATGALALALAGCGDDDEANPVIPPGPGGPSTFVGAFTNGTEHGKITVVINAADLAPGLRRTGAAASAAAPAAVATGTLTFSGGDTQILGGSYDSATDTLSLSGGGYAFVGEFEDAASPTYIAGGYTGPFGAGTFGAFSGAEAQMEVFLGAYQSDSTGATGVLDLVIKGTVAEGLRCPKSGETLFLVGSATGSGAKRILGLTSASPGLLDVSVAGEVQTTYGIGTWHSFDASRAQGDDGTWYATLSP